MMPRNARLPFMLALFLILTTQGHAAEEARIEKPAREAITAGNTAFVAAIASGDGMAIGRLYTERGQALPPNANPVAGREAIGQFWQKVMDSGVKKAELETVELEAQGPVAIEQGKYTLFGGAGETIDSGKYLVVWKKEAGTWRLHKDIWNSSLPAQ